MPPSMKASIGLCTLVAAGICAGLSQPSQGATAARPVGFAAAESPAPTASRDAASKPLDLPPPSAAAVVRATYPGGAHLYSAMVRRIARRYSVEWRLVMAIIASESGGDPSAVSAAGAVGLMQLMPDTASGLGVVDPWDPEQNVEGAVRYLSSLLATFGSVDLSLVAYNAGPGFALRYREGGVELGAETREFLARVGQFLNAEPMVRHPTSR